MKNKNQKERQQQVVSFTLLSKEGLEQFPIYKLYSSSGKCQDTSFGFFENMVSEMEVDLQKKSHSNESLRFSFPEYFENYLQIFNIDSVMQDNISMAKAILKKTEMELRVKGIQTLYPLTDDNENINKLMFKYSCLRIFRDNWIGDNRIKFSQKFLNLVLDENLSTLIYEHQNYDHDPEGEFYLPIFDFMRYYEPSADNDYVILPHFFTKQKANEMLKKLSKKETLLSQNGHLVYEYNLMKYLLEQVVIHDDILIIQLDQ